MGWGVGDALRCFQAFGDFMEPTFVEMSRGAGLIYDTGGYDTVASRTVRSRHACSFLRLTPSRKGLELNEKPSILHIKLIAVRPIA